MVPLPNLEVSRMDAFVVPSSGKRICAANSGVVSFGTLSAFRSWMDILFAGGIVLGVSGINSDAFTIQLTLLTTVDTTGTTPSHETQLSNFGVPSSALPLTLVTYSQC